MITRPPLIKKLCIFPLYIRVVSGVLVVVLLVEVELDVLEELLVDVDVEVVVVTTGGE